MKIDIQKQNKKKGFQMVYNGSKDNGLSIGTDNAIHNVRINDTLLVQLVQSSLQISGCDSKFRRNCK